ncbi:AAA family ATPase [Fundicoccus ignavus]|uniref:AAA family ATPase n=1 Tax=Fundicoccus ignavus TaxID=2664442 RepID=A0A844C2V3_9LACT|nr:AAA family ATPase [Fundicoccus ignavus]MRJ48434.1 AAA family ATPase [Fundicoccus ignavus]
MYLESISIKNYRKFGNEEQTIKFAHSSWADLSEDGENQEITELNTEKYLSKSSTLMVGKNNSGKSTVISLLKTLRSTRCGATDVFYHSDFNLDYLKDWYKKYIEYKSESDIKRVEVKDLPVLEFKLKIGIDEADDVIGKFEDVLIIRDLNTNKDEDVPIVIDIQIKYEVSNKTSFLKSLSELTSSQLIKLSKINLSNEEIKELFPEKTEVTIEELREKQGSEKIEKFIAYYDDANFRRFLQYIGGKNYVLNFYPANNETPANDFSLAPLLKVTTIDANTVKDDRTLSNAYNKIVSNFLRNNETDDMDEFVDHMNFQVKNKVDEKITEILQDAVTSIESAKNLQMNLRPNLNLRTIMNHGVIYEYEENGNYIPENQFGLGYTNLMVIISEIVDYIQLYGNEDVNGAVNVLCIEEPESFMHPQMQELFIKNISKAIAKLIGRKARDKFDTFQIIISTHSSSVLNSKIHSGNTLDNIVYLSVNDNSSIVSVNIKDEDILEGEHENKKAINYIKKYLRLEASDIFFADAAVLVEGVTEDTYIRYLIDQDEILNKHHIKVYRIDGAHSHMFVSLLNTLNIKTIIYTDLDLKRSKKEKETTQDVIKDLSDKINNELTTNASLKVMIERTYETQNAAEMNQLLVEKIDENEWLELSNDKITMFSQGKIQGNYATSFEEALILTNDVIFEDNKYKRSIIELLQYIRPGTTYIKRLEVNSTLVPDSYKLQVMLTRDKSDLSSGLVYLRETELDFELLPPKYIEIGLLRLREHFERESVYE